MNREDFDKLRGVPRSSCSGGHRHFNIMPDGSLYRCVELYYSGKGKVVGKLDDREGLKRILSNKTGSPCVQGSCFMQCDGYKTEQEIPNGVLNHVGCDIDNFGLRNTNYCILQIHMTSFCNWKCPYCCADSWMSKKMPDLKSEDWIEGAKLFIEEYSNGMGILMGGEPTVHKAWSQFCKVLLDGNWSIRLITNFSLHGKITDFIQTLSDEQRKRFLVNISLHPTQWKNGFDEFEHGIHNVTTLGAQVSCTVVDTPENRAAMKAMNVEERCRRFKLVWFDWIGAI